MAKRILGICTLLLAFSISSSQARVACVEAFSDAQCANELATGGYTNIEKIGECNPISLLGRVLYYALVECQGVTLSIKTFQDAACETPLAYQGYYGVGITGCKSVTADPEFAAVAATMGIPVAQSYQAQCMNQECPAPAPPVAPPSPSSPGGGPSSGGGGPKGGYGYGNGQQDNKTQRKEEGGGIVFLLFLCIFGISVACGCYWCTCCPWYQYRMGGSTDPAMRMDSIEIQTPSDADTNPLTFGNPVTAPVVVAGVPVEGPPSYTPASSQDPDEFAGHTPGRQ